MPDYPSQAPSPELAAVFVTRMPDPEQLVYDYIAAAAAGNLPAGAPSLGFYADQARALAEGTRIDVVRGWPLYPGRVPAIGVATGDEGEDPAQQTIQGGFVGTLPALDDAGNVVGLADYYEEPLYIPVVVQLIHENRDERDRLHNQLRMVLTPLRTWLPTQDPLIRQVRVDMSKDEASSDGPPVSEMPFTVYMSIVTVHVYCVAMTPRDIVDQTGIATAINSTVTPAP
jgi:hypothetical protein